MKNRLSIILVLTGTIFAGYLIYFFYPDYLSDLYIKIILVLHMVDKILFIWSLLRQFIIWIFPIIFGLIAIIISFKKPIISGLLMITGGSILLYQFIIYYFLYGKHDFYYLFLIPATLLITGGLIMLFGNKKS
ncbi:MAG: hypothetical protein NTU58_02505 [Candidatus Nealsonbacteria bacterium]|nr:hypothetical protein [Candidatus Nealsonbacteria bacterium]